MITTRIATLRIGSSLALLAATLAVTAGPSASAQNMVSREVVQPLPAENVQRLNRALVALAKSPQDRDTLLEAGTAAMEVDDLEAAIGFFGRAAEIDPGHPRVAQGLAGVYLRAGRAGEALVQFERALVAGVPERAVLADKALTLDLVGEQAQAQKAYARALELDPANDEARRRLAISHAISGNRAQFERALRPLLDNRDTAAQRARAFGLAILGDSVRAATIVEQIMPRDLSTRLVPYLGYMPRLTKPQQAAAANLGIFPRAADIGRDDPRLARFAAEERADSRLAPAGMPLGRRAEAVTPTTALTAPAATDAAVVIPASAPAPALRPAPSPSTPSPSAPPPSAPPARVADAFADLATGALPDTRVSGDVVDISRIAVRRELPPPPPEKAQPKEPAKPVHPSRVWVQVATGKNVNAFGFDWRRVARKGGEPLASLKPHMTPWGEAHRLLAGPVGSRDAAQTLVRELKAKGVDSFLYVSPEGEEIQPVK